MKALIVRALSISLSREHPLAGVAQPLLERLDEVVKDGAVDAETVADIVALNLELGRIQEAAELTETALQSWPAGARLHYLNGRLLRTRGRVESAIGAYRRATELDPALVDAWVSLGLALKQVGRLSHAQDALMEANRLAPHRADIFINLGHLASQRLAWSGAETCYRHALSLSPQADQARLGLALVLNKCNRYGEALEEWAQLSPAFARSFMGQRVLARSRYLAGDEGACRAALVAALEAALREGVDMQEIYRELVQTCELPDACTEVLKALLTQLPDSLALKRLYVDGLIRALRFDEAERSLGLPESLTTLDAVFIDSLKLLADLCPKHDWVARILDELLARGQRVQGLNDRLELGYVCYKLGRFAEAAPLHLCRAKCSDASFRGAGHERPRLWRGESLAGKRLVVWREQGLGDTLQMLRFLPHLHALAPLELIYLVSPELVPLVQLCPEVDRLVTVPSDAADADYHLPDMNCLAHFVRAESDIPKQVPYLRLQPDRVVYWRERLGPSDGRLRVAICWAGNPNLDQDRARSVPTQALAPLGDLPGIRWLSVQKGPLRALTQGPLPFAAEYLGDELTDLAETGALLSQVDWVVSVDSAVAHLAGALGRPVFLLNRVTSEYRWQLGRTDSPWYPTLRLFNQQRPFVWTDTLQELAAALAERVVLHLQDGR